MIQCILDTDTLESNWSKTVLIRSCLEHDDPTTFEVVIKSKVPGKPVNFFFPQGSVGIPPSFYCPSVLIYNPYL